MSPLAVELLVIVGLALANGLFAAAEIGILSVRKTRLRELTNEGSGAAATILRMRENPERFLATVQIGITVVAASAGAFGGATLARGITATLERTGAGAYSEDLALAIVIALISYLTIVLGELVPKSLALRHAERYSLLIARPLALLAWLGRPLVRFLTASSNVVLRIFRDETTFSEALLSKEELQQLVDEAATVGTVEPRSGEIASRALELDEVRVAALMVPRGDMVMLSRAATPTEIRRVLASGHQRIPVHGEGQDDVIGYVTCHDLVDLVVAHDRRQTLAEVVRTAMFVSLSQRAVNVMKEMQRSRDHLAIVVDEHGSVAGLITLEDILEELVGEIFGEHDAQVERMRREPDGTVVVRGIVPVHEINRELGLKLPEGTTSVTIGGLVMSLAGRIPRRGAKLRSGPISLEVIDATDRRVLQVRITPPEPAGARATSAG
jgi:putative hemolysin